MKVCSESSHADVCRWKNPRITIWRARWHAVFVGLCLAGNSWRCLAIGQPQYVEKVASPGCFVLSRNAVVAPLYMDAGDWPGAIRAMHDLSYDIKRVTGRPAPMISKITASDTNLVIIGTLGTSPIIHQLIKRHKLDVSNLSGKWESFLIAVVPEPLPGVEKALVIAGSDKRGTIYGIYDVSEQIGISPWCWWADVPVRHQDELFVKAGIQEQGPPAVKYRGIFLNDEAPSLAGWAREKYGGFNHAFYTNVFELLLRLKANFLWPAMWDNSFDTDDPLNPKLADEYGIVMGTSHHEPMMRAWKEWGRAGHQQGSWDYSKNPDALRAFWKDGIRRTKNYAKLITIGMRGDGDEPMSEMDSISLLEKIVAAQRQIISEVMHTNAADVPQVWALYKEVQGYYERGMRVPDDVTLLWCDDNWGNLRRLPTSAERRRSGGAGIYYHFDYVGGPRSYKWLNTVPITKVWEQMNLAHHYGANRIWIVNVGDLKPLEFPIEFFLTMAWNPQRWSRENLSEFTRLWAQREFGPKYANEIADIISKYTKYNGRRKPELLDPNTFSLVNYREAERVQAEWQAIANRAEQVYRALPADARDAFYELVLYPVKASATVNELYMTTGRNRLYARQGRAAANDLAAHARALFATDATLSDNYNHQLAGGKWDHMMDQTHIGYTNWQQPPSNIMPNVVEISLPKPARMGVAIQGSASAWPGSSSRPALPTFDVFNRQQCYVDVFNRGLMPFEFSVTASAPWIVLNAHHGLIQKQRRIWIGVDWNKVAASTNGFVKIAGAGTNVIVNVAVFRPAKPTPESLNGFVEANGHVSIEAEHCTKNVPAGNVRWGKIPDFGRTLSGMEVFPVTATSVNPPVNSPHLEYRMYLFHPGKIKVETIIAPTLNFASGRGLRFAISFDDRKPELVTAVPKDYVVDNGVRDWEESVKDGVRKIITIQMLKTAGYHTLKIWMVDPGVVMEKIVVDCGGVKPSYLGPPESFYHLAGIASAP